MPDAPHPKPETEPEAAQQVQAGRTRAGLRGQASARPDALLSLMGASDLDAEAVIKAIEVEPALCGRVVAVCHSVAGGGARGITTVRRAVLHLGPKRVKALGMAFGVQLMAEALTLPPRFMKQFWQTTLWKAEAARLLAEHSQPDLIDDAFMIGLLQDIGLPALLATRPEAFEAFADIDSGEWTGREVELFGIDHAQAGAELLHAWGVPEAICQAVATHHADDPEQIRIEPALRAPCRAAALIPHHPDRPLSDAGYTEWSALHAEHLSSAYETPRDALDAIAQRALSRADSAEASGEGNIAHILAPMLASVAETTAQLVGDSIPSAADLADPSDAAGTGRLSSEFIETLKYEAFTDDLTKLLSRRGFQRLAEERLVQIREDDARAVLPDAPARPAAPGSAPAGELAPASASALPPGRLDKRCNPRDGVRRAGTGAACVMLIDLNRFKPINDTHGHQAGDRALRALADALRRCIRSADLLGRLGGDEFVILLDHIPERAARRHAQRLHRACSGLPVRVTDEVTVNLTFSLGVAWMPSVGRGVTLSMLVDAADRAMYDAKRGDGGMSFNVMNASSAAA